MTFEEFLIKKKIDPVLFKTSEELLFPEFEHHFNQMGEKSFDHSKKFWFNKLRRVHPLQEQVKPDKLVESTSQNKESSIASDVKTSTKEFNPADSDGKTAYKPRFKAAVAETKEAASVQAEEQTPKPTFKPRFKAGITSVPKPSENSNTAVLEEAAKEEEKVAKPTAYKPRFKVAITVKDVASEESKSQDDIKEEDIEPQKQVYKPRFKPSMIKKTD